MITPNISRPKYNNFVDTASGDNTLQDKIKLYFFPGLFFILFSHFCSFMVGWGFGVGVLDWVFGLGFSVDEVWGTCCGAFLAFGVGALYINIEE